MVLKLGFSFLVVLLFSPVSGCMEDLKVCLLFDLGSLPVLDLFETRLMVKVFSVKVLNEPELGPEVVGIDTNDVSGDFGRQPLRFRKHSWYEWSRVAILCHVHSVEQVLAAGVHLVALVGQGVLIDWHRSGKLLHGELRSALEGQLVIEIPVLLRLWDLRLPVGQESWVHVNSVLEFKILSEVLVVEVDLAAAVGPEAHGINVSIPDELEVALVKVLTPHAAPLAVDQSVECMIQTEPVDQVVNVVEGLVVHCTSEVKLPGLVMERVVELGRHSVGFLPLDSKVSWGPNSILKHLEELVAHDWHFEVMATTL